MIEESKKDFSQNVVLQTKYQKETWNAWQEIADKIADARKNIRPSNEEKAAWKYIVESAGTKKGEK